MIALSSGVKPSLAALALVAMVLPAAADLIAIDVLLEPDATMRAAAQEWNARLRDIEPDGFELDETHQPHVTLLQSYVDVEDLLAVIEAVERVAADTDVTGLELEAIGLYHIPAGEIGLQGIVIEPSDDLIALQRTVIDAVAPFKRSGGDEQAFVPDPTGTPFDPFLFGYVETFATAQSGDAFNPHVTTGVGPLDFLEARESEAFGSFQFGVDGIAIFQLGNFGTASRLVWRP